MSDRLTGADLDRLDAEKACTRLTDREREALRIDQRGRRSPKPRASSEACPPHVNVWGSVHDLGRPPAIDMADPA